MEGRIAIIPLPSLLELNNLYSLKPTHYYHSHSGYSPQDAGFFTFHSSFFTFYPAITHLESVLRTLYFSLLPLLLNPFSRLDPVFKIMFDLFHLGHKIRLFDQFLRGVAAGENQLDVLGFFGYYVNQILHPN